MLTDSITINDGTTDRTYVLVSREGMNSLRRETTAGVTSRENSGMVIKHTIDPKNLKKPNRHLVSLSRSAIDAVTGSVDAVTVHVVITRAKNAPDTLVLAEVAQLANWLDVPANQSALLIGAN